MAGRATLPKNSVQHPSNSLEGAAGQRHVGNLQGIPQYHKSVERGNSLPKMSVPTYYSKSPDRHKRIPQVKSEL